MGNVRVDGSSLWPDEATETPMQPVYAAMDLEALVGSTGRMLGHKRPQAARSRGQLVVLGRKSTSTRDAGLIPRPPPAGLRPTGDSAAPDASPFLTDGTGEPAGLV